MTSLEMVGGEDAGGEEAGDIQNVLSLKACSIMASASEVLLVLMAAVDEINCCWLGRSSGAAVRVRNPFQFSSTMSSEGILLILESKREKEDI